MTAALDEEQQNVDSFHQFLRDYVEHLHRRIGNTQGAPSTGTGQDELEREAHLGNLQQQLHAARAAGQRLCFGRITDHEGDSRHIGRLGLRDEHGEVVLVDWRAPQAASFYQATTADPMNLALRRRIATRHNQGRDQVTHVDDEYFTAQGSSLANAAANAVDAPREGRMADILATIAADQDAIIRSPLNQVTVVQGGPGTGKTVVALHRAAWLLYTYRERLARDGVLVIGPSTMFLRYIDQVLPSLGETDVVLLTTAQLYPGVSASHSDARNVARVKGDARMAKVITQFLAHRVRIPESDVTITTEDHAALRISRQQLRESSRGLSRTSHFHESRETFLRRALESIARNRLRDQGDETPDARDIADAISDIVDDRNVRRTLNLMWMPISPEELVTRLLTREDVLASSADGILSAHEQALILRNAHDPWTVDDIPLLDEAAYALGPWIPPRPHADPESSGVRELDAREMHVANQFHEERSQRTLAERAGDDREWVYGHVIVDEAQELSTMAWRAVERRATRKSMTIVGDIQQASHPAAAESWSEALSWAESATRIYELTITYRITEQIAQTATDWLVRCGGHAPVLEPIRQGEPVTSLTVNADSLAAHIVSFCAERDGRAAVIVPESELQQWANRLLDPAFGFGYEAMDAPIAVMTAQDSKGLEFDHVFVVDPHVVADERERGANIYVACTRATQTLTLVDVSDKVGS